MNNLLFLHCWLHDYIFFINTVEINTPRTKQIFGCIVEYHLFLSSTFVFTMLLILWEIHHQSTLGWLKCWCESWPTTNKQPKSADGTTQILHNLKLKCKIKRKTRFRGQKLKKQISWILIELGHLHKCPSTRDWINWITDSDDGWGINRRNTAARGAWSILAVLWKDHVWCFPVSLMVRTIWLVMKNNSEKL